MSFFVNIRADRRALENPLPSTYPVVKVMLTPDLRRVLGDLKSKLTLFIRTH